MSTKINHKKRRRRAQRRKRIQLWIYIGVLALVSLCACGLVIMLMTNDAASKDGHAHSAAGNAPIAVEASPEASLLLPTATPEPTATPTPEPTPEPTPTPTPKPTPAPETIVITATGDTTLGTYKTKHGISNFRRVFNKQGADYFFDNFRDYFSEDDLTIVNLEGPLTKYSEKRAGRTFNFRGYPEYVDILQSGSVEICNMANNHALDYREKGFEDTYQNLTNAGIGASGYGPEYYTEINGYTVGSVGYTEWNFEAKDILDKVAEASKKCDLLIVSMHWNKEHAYKLSNYCLKMGQALIDAGADLVIGNHSHVIGEITQYKGKYIINSLGNFCFGGNDDPYVRECVVFRQKFIMHWDGTVEDGGIDLVPALVSSTEEKNDFQPRIATPEEGKEILDDIAELSETINYGDLLWLEDAYILQNGILTEDPQAAADAQAAADMEIALDTAR